ncbi:MAG: diguanylate cyclase, partial [Pseudomonadota bacterium]
MMEYPSKNDFFLNFKALIDDKDHFVDYILVNISESFSSATDVKAEHILGRRISEIVQEYDNSIFGIKDIYYSMIPKTRRKFEKYIKELDRWYLISIFSDSSDFLMLFYNDVTKIKKSKEAMYYNPENTADIYHLNEKHEAISYKDKLTGLYSRDFFDEELSRLDSERQLPISLIMGDLNGLKLINDAFGHETGDKALKRVSEIMKRNFRKEDIISRVGGDEFIVLLPKTSEKVAMSIVKRIKNDCNANPMDFVKISISLGVSSKTAVDEDIRGVQKKAEDRMYFNKLTESKEAKLSMIDYIRDKLEEMKFESKEHVERLKKLCLMIAGKLGLSEIEKEELRLLCEYHDIGEIGIPSRILNKKEALSKSEWKSLRRHSEIGYYIIGGSRETLAINELILMHHERWDGKG